MLALIFAVALLQEAPTRTPAIYRCPAAEAESKFFPLMLEEDGFDTYCIEPKPGPKATAAIKGKAKLIDSKLIDTPANLKWRDAAIEFVNGKISPKAWLEKTKGLKETVHFLSSPKTQQLREATNKQSFRAVFAEMLILSMPGKPCLTSNDTGQTRYLPEDDVLLSWTLAMRDYLGPMLYMRSRETYVVNGKPNVVRADAKPGLMILSYTTPKYGMTFYFNNSKELVKLPKFDMERMTINLGLDIEEETPRLRECGFMIVHTGEERT